MYEDPFEDPVTVTILNSPGEVEDDIKKFLLEMTENPFDVNLNQPSNSGTQQIKIHQNIQFQSPVLDSDTTQYTIKNKTNSDEIKILDEIINTVNQTLIYTQSYRKLIVNTDTKITKFVSSDYLFIYLLIYLFYTFT